MSKKSMTGYDAKFITRAVWDERRAEMTAYLLGRGFNPKAVPKLINNFINTIAFVAEQTGEPMLGNGPKDTHVTSPALRDSR